MLLKTKQYLFLRYEKHETLFESFFISAILAILGIRLFLEATGYPQLGGERGFHIAHVLWGGLLMLIAFQLLLLFVSNSLKSIAAFIGGLGFGTFIDELGKFITKDNDYFFHPTFAIIYFIFIIIFLLYTLIKKLRPFSPEEYLVNSVEILKDVIINDLDIEEQKRALVYLEKGGDNKVSFALKKLYSELKNLPTCQLNIFLRWRKQIIGFYRHLAARRLVDVSVITLFVIQAFFNLFLEVTIILGIGWLISNWFFPNFLPNPGLEIDYLDILEIAASFVSGMLVIIGVVNLRRNRLKALAFFRYSILISLFIIRVFDFNNGPVGAFIGVLFDLSLLAILDFMAERESISTKET